MARPRPNRDSGRHGWLPAAVALALLAAQGAGLAHFALLRHAYCPEHGELIHPESAPQADVSRGPSSAPGLYGSKLDRSHGHEHCILSGLRREAILASRSAPVAVVPECSGDREPATLPAFSSTPRFRLAPKQSPPA
jgi:hypothetical protein